MHNGTAVRVIVFLHRKRGCSKSKPETLIPTLRLPLTDDSQHNEFGPQINDKDDVEEINDKDDVIEVDKNHEEVGVDTAECVVDEQVEVDNDDRDL
uniref:Uncharacterized protein n=1 Tax=Quercus lobata TaxID=97700 RepID=A0A7N2L493_QUELO